MTPSWDEYFIDIAKTVALKSKDPSSKVGCVIVTKDHRPISFGYNGFVRGCNESHMTYERPLKYHMIIHAEMNAIMFAKDSLEGSKVYCTHGPCDNCLKHLLQNGVSEIIYDDPGIMVQRGSDEAKESILRLIYATNVSVKRTDGTPYLDQLFPDNVK